MMIQQTIYQFFFISIYYSGDTSAWQQQMRCTRYGSVLPHGQCPHLDKQNIALTENKILSHNEHIEQWFNTYIPLYRSLGPASLKLLLSKYINVCGKDAKKIDKLISAIDFPSANAVEKCSQDAKKFICDVSNPLCIGDGKRIALPCRDRCLKIWNVNSCNFMSKAKEVLVEISHLCPTWSNNIKSMLSIINCEYYGNKPILDGYCLPEVNERSQPPKPLFHHFSMISLDDAKPTLTCAHYHKLLPHGFCRAYLHGKEVAQTEESALKTNERLDQIYNYIEMYLSYSENDDKILKRLITFYSERYCGENRKISKLIDSVVLPSGTEVKKCANELKRFVCLASHPVCMKDNEGNKQVFKPCRDQCTLALENPSCSFVMPLMSTIKKVEELCPELKKKMIVETSEKVCQNFPQGRILGQSMCPTSIVKSQMNTFSDGLIGYEDIEISNDMAEPSNYQTNNEHMFNSESSSYGNINKYQNILQKSNLALSNKELKKSKKAHVSITPTPIVREPLCNRFKDFSNSMHVCDPYLSDSYVEREDKEKTLSMGSRYMYIDMLLEEKSASNGTELLSFIWTKFAAGCTNATFIQLLKEKFTKEINVDKTKKCLNKNTWFYCNIFHTKCLKGKGDFIKSPVCSDSCQKIKNDKNCSFINQLHNIYQEIKKKCTVPYQEKIEQIFDCTRLPQGDMKYIEKCQKVPEPSIKTYSCLIGDGQGFSGYSQGRKCVNWGLNPYLDKKTYPYLLWNAPFMESAMSSFCRNPQGYGQTVWCYTNMTTRARQYCLLPKCIEIKSYGDGVQREIYVEGNTTIDVFYNPYPLIASRSTSTHTSHSTSVSETTASVTGIVMTVVAVLIAIGCLTLVFSYSKRKRGTIKEYRGINQRPDINYVQVDADGN